MKILVCGGRDYNDVERVFEELDEIHKATPITCVIQGLARGADDMARLWAKERKINECCGYGARWDLYGRSAGPRRNRQMLDEEHTPENPIDLVVAFPGGRGTAHMVGLAKAVGIPVKEIK